MSNEHQTPIKQKRFAYITRKQIIISILSSLAFNFSFFIAGPLGFFFSANNRGFFETNNLYASIVVPVMVVISVVAFLLLSIALIILPQKANTICISIITWFLVCGYLQVLLFNGWTNGLIGDGNANLGIPGSGIPNLLMWLLLGVLIIGAPLLIKGKLKKIGNAAKMIVVYLLVLVLAMQGAGFLETVITSPEETSIHYYLSYDNIFDVSENENIIVFIVDRFDASFYESLKKSDPDFANSFDGFTAYTDNMSLYSRTYPAVTSILTGISNDFSNTKEEYFESAYNDNTFFPDLKNAGYDINVFAANYYTYTDASIMQDYVDNVAYFGNEVHLNDTVGFIKAMIKYSLYIYGPDLIKNHIAISSRSFAELATKNTGYICEDSVLYQKWQEAKGLSTKDSNNFSFIHLRGCHEPYYLDENANNVGDNNSTGEQQILGVFKLIKEYINDLKSKGLYENATIIITGDHGIDEYPETTSPKITALLVKEKGKAGSPLTESSAPVCQANLIPTIIKSAGISTDTDYGQAYSEINEDDIITRTYLFEKTVDRKDLDELVEFNVTGCAKDFNNWTIIDRETIGYFYK